MPKVKRSRKCKGPEKLITTSLTILPEELELYRQVSEIEGISISQWARTILTRVAKDVVARERNYKFFVEVLPTMQAQQKMMFDALAGEVSVAESMLDNAPPGTDREELEKIRAAIAPFSSLKQKK